MRYASLDVLRATAVVLMIVVHFSENLSGTESYGLLPAGFGAPLFTLLSGVSYRLWVRGQQTRGVPESRISQRTMRRGLFLFGLGFAFNVLIWFPEDIYNWDVLTFVGAGLIFLNFARHLSHGVLALIAFLSFAFSPVLRQIAQFESYWIDGYFQPDQTLSDVLLGFLTTGYFPFFPWMLYPVTGYVVAATVFPDDRDPERSTTRRLAGIGAAMLTLAIAILLFRSYAPVLWQQRLLHDWTMFPPSNTYVLTTLGFAMLALITAHAKLDRPEQAARYPRMLEWARTFSAHSLTIYVLHHVAHLWPLWVVGAASGNEATHYWRNAMPLVYSLPLSFVFVGLCYALLRWLDRTGRTGIEGWMRWLCD